MKKILPFTILALVHLWVLINLQFTAWPEMLSFPYLLNHGFRLYGDMVYAYPPLLTIILSGIYRIVGMNPIILEIFTWIGILASDVLIFLIVRQLTDKYIPALLALGFYISTQPFLDGNMLWFDTALTLPILLAVYFRKNILLSGVFLAAALLIKQTAVIFIAVFLAYHIFSKSGFKKILMFLLPILVSFGVFVFYLLLNGEFTHFYNWTFYFPATFWTKYPSYEILSLSKREIVSVFLVLLPGLVVLLTRQKKFWFLLLLLAASIVAVYPRFSFYHFQPALAISAVLFGVAAWSLKIGYKYLIIYFFAVILIISFPALRTGWGREVRFLEKADVDLAEVIAQETKEEESIYLIGPHSAVFVMSGRLPPKPWIDNYGWYFEIPEIQERTLASWSQNLPQAIVIQDPNPGEWYEIGTYQPQKVLEWVRANYNKEKEVKSGVWLWRRK